MMFTVIAFDIVDDRTRYRVVKALRQYAARVQKSVFEAPNLRSNEFQRLKDELERLIDLKRDAVRYYFLRPPHRSRGSGRVRHCRGRACAK